MPQSCDIQRAHETFPEDELDETVSTIFPILLFVFPSLLPTSLQVSLRRSKKTRTVLRAYLDAPHSPTPSSKYCPQTLTAPPTDPHPPQDSILAHHHVLRRLGALSRTNTSLRRELRRRNAVQMGTGMAGRVLREPPQRPRQRLGSGA